jgi:hypothetical protein
LPQNNRRPRPTTANRRSSLRGKPSERFGDAPDLTPEEYKRRGDAADALFRELVRRANPA